MVIPRKKPFKKRMKPGMPSYERRRLSNEKIERIQKDILNYIRYRKSKELKG